MELTEIATKRKKLNGRWRQRFIDNWAFFLIAVFLLFLLIVFVILGDSIIIHPNDTIDSNIAYYQAKRNAWLSGKLKEGFVSPILGGDSGTDRLFEYDFYHNCNIICFLYLLLPAIKAYQASYIIRIILSIAGWLLLLYAAFDCETYKKLKNWTALLGLAYGLLPIWPMTMAISLLPLILAICTLAYKKNSIVFGFILVFIIFVGGVSFPLVGCFFLGFLFLALLILAIHAKQLNKGLFFCFLLSSVAYALMNYQIIINVITGNTIRSSFTSISTAQAFSLGNLVSNFSDVVKYGVYHCPPMQRYFILPFCFLSFGAINLNIILRREKLKKIFFEPFNWTFLLFWICCVCTAIGVTPGAMDYLYRFFPWLRGLSFQRFSYFCPLALYGCMFFVLYKVVRDGKKKMPPIIVAATCLSVLFGFPTKGPVTYNDFKSNFQYYLLDESPFPQAMTVKAYYSTELFSKIKEEIGYQGEWSVAFGFYPSILTYNGINTLDGYDSGCSSEYNEQFTKLIAPYLEYGEKYVSYFQSSGIRAYVFSDENPYEGARYRDAVETEILFDSDEFRLMGGKYVFSLASITNADEKGLCLIRSYEDSGQPYNVFVYAID